MSGSTAEQRPQRKLYATDRLTQGSTTSRSVLSCLEGRQMASTDLLWGLQRTLEFRQGSSRKVSPMDPESPRHARCVPLYAHASHTSMWAFPVLRHQSAAGHKFVGTRDLMALMAPEELAIAGHAVALSQWHQVSLWYSCWQCSTWFGCMQRTQFVGGNCLR